MRLVISPAARTDIEAIGDFIAADSPSAALRFVDDLRQRCVHLLDAPHGSAPRPELGPGIRATPFGRYVIFHKANGDTVTVVRVLHSARDIGSEF
jgi:toxin ParE1/3/4